MKTRITQLTVAPEGADLYDDRSTRIGIYDEGDGDGEFIRVVQPNGPAGIRMGQDEWPIIRAAIDRLFEECNK